MHFAPSLEDWKPDGRPSAVTIGMFDGLHLGHQALLRTLVDGARERGLRSVVLTFDQNPRSALAGEPPAKCITDLPEKLALLDDLGVDLCAIIPVAGGVLSLDAADFVQSYLTERLCARLMVVGYDFRFGRDRRGDFSLLQAMCGACGYTVLQSDPVLVRGKPVKSTWIRNCIREGNMPGAAELLGRPYGITGPVVAGAKLGRQIGFPTANIRYSPEKLLPASGVYAGIAHVDAVRWPAAINLGTRPSVAQTSDHPPTVLEAHLCGFSGDLYGGTVTLDLMKRLREERRFESVDALKAQIQRDVAEVAGPD